MRCIKCVLFLTNKLEFLKVALTCTCRWVRVCNPFYVEDAMACWAMRRKLTVRLGRIHFVLRRRRYSCKGVVCVLLHNHHPCEQYDPTSDQKEKHWQHVWVSISKLTKMHEGVALFRNSNKRERLALYSLNVAQEAERPK